jgi:hypothetical protein
LPFYVRRRLVWHRLIDALVYKYSFHQRIRMLIVCQQLENELKEAFLNLILTVTRIDRGDDLSKFATQTLTLPNIRDFPGQKPLMINLVDGFLNVLIDEQLDPNILISNVIGLEKQSPLFFIANLIYYCGKPFHSENLVSMAGRSKWGLNPLSFSHEPQVSNPMVSCCIDWSRFNTSRLDERLINHVFLYSHRIYGPHADRG